MILSVVAVVASLPYLTESYLLETRGPQSNATCQTGFQWADNDAQLSPCIVAAAVVGGCGTSNYNVPALQEGNHYNAPGENGQVVTECACSWAAYNLYSACTACQGLDSSILTWADYRTNCSSFVSTTTYYPSDVVTLGNTSIPYYASIDPTTWQGQIFNVAQAQNISNEDHADLSGSATSSAPASASASASSTKKTPVGAIVGGVIGGLVVLAIGALAAFFMLRRRIRARKGPQEIDSTDNTFQASHGRSFSDLTRTSDPVMSSYNGHCPPVSVTTTPPPAGGSTILTGPGTMQTFSMYDSASGFTTPPQAAPSTRYGSPTPSVQYMNRPDAVQPLVLTSNLFSQGPIMRPATPRKVTSGTTVYDPSNARPEPHFETEVLEETPSEVSSRPRLNPPAYSPYPAPGSEASSADVAAQRRERHGTGHRPPVTIREKGGSSDSPFSSLNSLGSRGDNESTVDHAAGLDAVVDQMGYGRPRMTEIRPGGGGAQMTTTTTRPSVPMLHTAAAPLSPIRHVVNSATENDDETVTIA